MRTSFRRRRGVFSRLKLAEPGLAPTLPERLRTPGKSCAVRNLSFRGVDFAVRYEVRTESRLRVILEHESDDPIEIEVRVREGQPIVSVTERRQRDQAVFECENGWC